MPESVREAVRRSVANWRFAPHLTDDAIDIEATDLACDPSPLVDSMTGDVVTVSIEIEAVHAVPDILQSWGLTLAKHTLRTTSVLRKE